MGETGLVEDEPGASSMQSDPFDQGTDGRSRFVNSYKDSRSKEQGRERERERGVGESSAMAGLSDGSILFANPN